MAAAPQGRVTRMIDLLVQDVERLGRSTAATCVSVVTYLIGSPNSSRSVILQEKKSGQ